jgi:hypothetical protein
MNNMIKAALAALCVCIGCGAAHAEEDCTSANIVARVKEHQQMLRLGESKPGIEARLEFGEPQITDYDEPTRTYTCEMHLRQVVVAQGDDDKEYQSHFARGKCRRQGRY